MLLVLVVARVLYAKRYAKPQDATALWLAKEMLWTHAARSLCFMMENFVHEILEYE
jgi:hypothetical protein